MSVHSIGRRAPARRDAIPRFRDAAAAEHALNAALLAADITNGFEDFLAIVDAFYADGVQITNAATGRVIDGKPDLRAVVQRALVPFHIVAESGGLLVSLRQTAQVRSDLDNVHDSDWSLEITVPGGGTSTRSWSCTRRWRGGQAISEHHYNVQ